MRKAYTGFANPQDAADDVDSLRFLVRQMMNGMATATLVEVVSADASTKTVNVKPMVKQIDGAGNTIDHGTIHNIPYFTIRGGAAAIKLTPRAGDIGMVAFCHSDISGVKETGTASAPSTRRRFDWSDGLYFGGFLSRSTPTTFIEVDPDTGVTITSPAGITINGDVQHSGNWTTTGTITGETDVVGNGTSLHSHKHGGVQTGSSQTGSPV